MILSLSFKHMKSSDAVRDFVEEKSAKLEKYFHGNMKMIWNFSADKEGQVAHCHVLGNHIDFFAESKSGQLYDAIEDVVRRVDAQMRKHKEKVTNKIHRRDQVDPLTLVG